MELMELPDDAVVSVLRFLTAQELLTCRLVCKRLGALALHWDAWRHREIDIKKLDAPLASALLHLVPCLQRATVGERDILALTRSKCAVADLNLIVFERSPVIAFYYAEAVQNQEALGRLRRLHLLNLFRSDDYGTYDEDAIEELAKTVMSCSALVELDIVGTLLVTTRPVTLKPVRPSLKKLSFVIADVNLPFINALLAGHSATLEEVTLSSVGGRYSDTIPRLLGDIPHLSSLKCHAMPGLQAVAACSTLKKLCLSSVQSSEPTIVRDAAELLRLAKQLHEVKIHTTNETPPGVRVAELLMKALGSSGSRLIVEHLELTLFPYAEMQALHLTLPSLPALRILKLTEEYTTGYRTPVDALDKLLLAITPETAPALEALQVTLCNFECSHAWIHRAAVSEVLAVNPSLHLLLFGVRTFRCDDCNTCSCTQCHEEVGNKPWLDICLFSHESRKCSSPYHFNQWIQICK